MSQNTQAQDIKAQDTKTLKGLALSVSLLACLTVIMIVIANIFF